MGEGLVRIGITTYGRDETNRYRLPAEYVDSVRRAGALPLLLPPGEPRPRAWLEVLDGIVLAGGGDLAPETYGVPAHPECYDVGAERDQTELGLARDVLDAALPVLAICRGLQVLNVALGGTLHPHLPETYGEKVAHRAPPREPIRHPVVVDAGTRLADHLGRTTLSPYSWHHQSIDRLADGAVVVARAADGVIEAIDLPGHDALVAAVQWHPELSSHEDEDQQRLFDALVAACRRAGCGG